MTTVAQSALGALALSEELAETAERLQRSVVQVRTGRGGIGSGIIWQERPSRDGAAEPEVLVITNEHVVRASGDSKLTILVHDGRTLAAEPIDHDPEHDLALLRTRASGLQPAQIGNSSELRVGELVIAVGNPFGKLNTLTAGIVAARAPADPDLPLEPAEPERAPGGDDGPRERASRTPDLIQADVRLYPGNSGGPLADIRGRVVGVNSMVGGGLAFAIPSRIVDQFIELSSVTGGARPRLGVQVVEVDVPASLRARSGVNAASGVMVAAVETDSPAAAADLLVGDLIVELGGRRVASARDLLLALRTGDPFAARTVVLLRGGERREVSVTLLAQPGAAAA
jgi:serine protease Do